MQPQPRPASRLPRLGAPYTAHGYLQRRHGCDTPPSVLPQGHRFSDRLQPSMASALHHCHGFHRSSLSQHHLAPLQQCEPDGRQPCAHSVPRRVQQPPVELLHPPRWQQLAPNRCQDHFLVGASLGLRHHRRLRSWIFPTRTAVQGARPQQATDLPATVSQGSRFRPIRVHKNTILPPNQLQIVRARGPPRGLTCSPQNCLLTFTFNERCIRLHFPVLYDLSRRLFDSNLLFWTNELVRYCCLIPRAWKLLAAHTAGVGTCRSTPAEPLITIDELEKDG
jgi:hypothetical protein